MTDHVSGYECTIEMEGGTDQAVYLGMEFWYPPALTAMSGQVTITRVDTKTCIGHLIAFGGEKQEFKPPTEGETLKTVRDELQVPVPQKPAETPPAKPPTDR